MPNEGQASLTCNHNFIWYVGIDSDILVLLIKWWYLLIYAGVFLFLYLFDIWANVWIEYSFRATLLFISMLQAELWFSSDCACTATYKCYQACFAAAGTSSTGTLDAEQYWGKFSFVDASQVQQFFMLVLEFDWFNQSFSSDGLINQFQCSHKIPVIANDGFQIMLCVFKHSHVLCFSKRCQPLEMQPLG